MKRIIIGVLLLIVFQTGYAQTEEITTFILVRHAEKASDGTSDPDLKPEGKQRADALAAMLSKASVDAVYSTNYKRTRNTVASLAAVKNLTVNTYNTMDAIALEKLLQQHSGGTIVIAGHSNTIPEIANALIREKKLEQFGDDDYGNILIISVIAIGKNAKVTWLRF
jgi:2,3-bisphosphoglycerate-dependent phosphoglycerate mutase